MVIWPSFAGLSRFRGGWVSWVNGGVAVLAVICEVVFGSGCGWLFLVGSGCGLRH